MGDEPRSTTGDAVAAVVLPLVLVIGVLVPIALMIWRGVSPDVVARQADVGRFVEAETTAGGLLAPPMTTVRTSVASVMVTGSFSARRDSPLVIEYMSQSGLRLCVAGTRGRCVPVEGDWAGDLQPTAVAAQAFDFYSHGLTSRALVGWLVIGLFVFFCGLITWSLNSTDLRAEGHAGQGKGG